MSSSSGILSQTLQSITNTKIEELHQQQATFEGRKRQIVESASGESDQAARVEALLSGIVGLSTTSKLDAFEDYELSGENTGGLSLKSIWRFLEQSRYDPSVDPSLLQEWEQKLRLLLDQRTRKHEYADLYARLLTEWLSDTSTVATPPADTSSDSASLDGSFEMVARTKLQQLRETFESYVFKPVDIDSNAINEHLDGLFGDEKATKALQGLREQVKSRGDMLISAKSPFDGHSLRWCIQGLLKNELLTEQKKTLLEEFLRNEVVLAEIADVLNMRFTNLQAWSWGAQGVFVEPRRQLNGKYRVMMDEDILQAIFLQYIGIQWSIAMKSMLKTLINNTDVWKKPPKHLIPKEAVHRREYYLGRTQSEFGQGLALQRKQAFENDYFLAQLPDTMQAGARASYDDEEDDEPNENVKTPLQIRKQLLHQIGAELLIHRALHGEVAVVQSDLQWFYTSLSHSTIFTVLSYFGMSESWIKFFRVYLETPLRVLHEGQQEPEVRIRKRGVPIAHAISNFMAEVVLFALDLSVNREAEGTLLYRLTDDLWIWGDPASCKDAWKAVQRSVKVLGLTINEKKSGSISPEQSDLNEADSLPKGDVNWGFLKLDPGTGRWTIDQNQVDRHTKQLKRQLLASKSVLSFVQLWNSCIDRFFKRVLGEPANCFGREHVEMILLTHKRIQSHLFDNATNESDSVPDHLKRIVEERFGVTNLPDGFFYLPEELGGLALCNPFVDYLCVRDGLVKSPQKLIEDFLEREKEAYQRAREYFDAYGGYATSRKSHERSRKSKEGDKEVFMSFTEFTQYRELTSDDLKRTYDTLCAKPEPRVMDSSTDAYTAVNRLPLAQKNLFSNDMKAGTTWLIHLYASELVERFGGLNIVDKGLLPLGVMQMLRSKKVTWQEVL